MKNAARKKRYAMDMHVRLTPEQRAQIDDYAAKYCGENASYALRKAIEIGLKAMYAELPDLHWIETSE